MKHVTDILFDSVLVVAIVSCFLCTTALMIELTYHFIIGKEIGLALLFMVVASAMIGSALTMFFIKLKGMEADNKPKN